MRDIIPRTIVGADQPPASPSTQEGTTKEGVLGVVVMFGVLAGIGYLGYSVYKDDEAKEKVEEGKKTAELVARNEASKKEWEDYLKLKKKDEERAERMRMRRLYGDDGTQERIDAWYDGMKKRRAAEKDG